MTIEKATQLEEVNNELIQVLIGLVARVEAIRETLRECGHDHQKAITILSTFQANDLLKKVMSFVPDGGAMGAIKDMAKFETQAEYVAARLSGEPVDHPVTQEELDAHGTLKAVPSKCQNPSCVDGLAPRKTGPDEGDVDMEPCPVCGGP